MLTLPANIRIFVARVPADMRKSFRGLSGLIRGQLGRDPLSGHLFCFFNKRRTLCKIFFYDRHGFSIFYKKLAKGTFQLPAIEPNSHSVELDPGTLAMILEGIDLAGARHRRRHRPSLEKKT